MNCINWHSIADAIREGRFEDVTPEVWKRVADKIEAFTPIESKKELPATVKRGKGRPKKPKPPKWNKDLSTKENVTKFFKYFNKRKDYEKNKEQTAFDKCFEYGIYEIEELYEKFQKQGYKSNDALEKVCKSLPFAIGAKTIEALLTEIRADRKASNEAQEAELKT